MNSLLLTFLGLSMAISLQNCTAVTCNGYNSTSKECLHIRNNSNQYYLDFYGAPISGKFHYCPLDTMYCNLYQNFTTDANCSPLQGTGQSCRTAYQCLSGLCVLGKCASIQGSNNFNCVTNPDCEFGLSCISGKCAKPKVLGAACTNITTYGNYDLGMDQNECDYTKQLICAYTYTGSINYNATCMKLFTVTSNNVYVSNPLLCSTMVTNSNDENGWAPGYCISDRAQYLLKLTYDTGVNYKTCASDSDCVYTINGTSTYQTPSYPCQCADADAKSQSYCVYGGGEPDLISDVKYYQTNWVPNYDMIYNVHAFKYSFVLDTVERMSMINPAYCSLHALWKNATVQNTTTSSIIIFYIIVAALFAIGFVGLIVVFFMC